MRRLATPHPHPSCRPARRRTPAAMSAPLDPRPGASATEMAHLVLPYHANVHGTVLGGTVGVTDRSATGMTVTVRVTGVAALVPSVAL